VPPGHEEGKEHAMPRHSSREHDYPFGQAMLTLRKSIRLTQAGLADRLGVSRRAIGEWEGGLNYPKAEHFQHFLELCVQQHVFTPEREEEEIRALWKTAHQRVLLDEAWLAALLAWPSATPVPVEEAGGAAVVSLLLRPFIFPHRPRRRLSTRERNLQPSRA
jgi:transcriptional regulator with XRE-family HTH domain